MSGHFYNIYSVALSLSLSLSPPPHTHTQNERFQHFLVFVRYFRIYPKATIPSTEYNRSKHPECVQYYCCLGSMITNDVRGTREIKYRIATARTTFNKQKAVSTSISDSNLRKKLGEGYPWSIALHGAETWTLRKVDQKYLGRFEMWCWRWMGKINWTDRLSN